MKFRNALALFLISIFSSTTVFCAYIVSDDVYDDSIKLDDSNSSSYNKVNFIDNNKILKTMYVKDGEFVTLNDLPSNEDYIINGNDTEIVRWEDGNNVLSVDNNGYTLGIQVYSDLNFSKTTEKLVSGGVPTSGNETDFSSSGNVETGFIDGDVNINGNEIIINEGQNNDVDSANEVTIDMPVISDSTITTNFKTAPNNEEGISQDLGNSGTTQHSTDTTIGLEDPTDEIVSNNYYKPNKNTSSSINPCVTRIKLGQDTSILAGTTFNIGARTGFYNGNGWSQFNWQGFINGSFNELDLNGHTLVIGNGCTLNAIGSIVDSAGTGKIIIENGGTLQATFVVEDQAHETHMPVAYLYGDPIFKMYRCPYINAKVVFKKGSSFYGYCRIDFGGDSNGNYYDKLLGLIGCGSEFMVDMSDSASNSYITREPYYDADLINYVDGESVTKNNIVYQKFKYNIYDAKIKIHSFDFQSISISGMNFDIDWNRTDTYIPPYFSFYVFNSEITIDNNYIFFPGSYLYIDESSNLILTAGNYGEYELSGIGDVVFNYDGSLPDYYQNVGGLMFIHEKFDYTECYRNGSADTEYGWVDDVDNDKGEKNNNGTHNLIFSGTTKFWIYQNEFYSAKADIDGTIEFDNNVSLYKENYHLGGEINITDVDMFATNVNNSGKVNLFNSIFTGATNAFKLAGKVRFNVSDYYAYPLVSNNNVLMNLNENNKVRDDFKSKIIRYDFDFGSINDGENYYIYIYKDYKGVYNNWVNHLNKVSYKSKWVIGDWLPKIYDLSQWSSTSECVDDLRVVLTKVVNLDTANQIYTVDGGQYIYFHGGFFKYENGKVDIHKFRNDDSNYPSSYGGDDTRKVIFDTTGGDYYSHAAWRLA